MQALCPVKIVSTRLVCDRIKDASRGFGFVEFPTVEVYHLNKAIG